MRGVRVVSWFMLVTFFPNRIVFRHLFNFNHISAPAAPPLSNPGEPLYIRTWPFFFFISLNPKEAKSAKKSISIFSTDIFENRCLNQTIPLKKHIAQSKIYI